MSYQVHNFQTGQKIEAAPINEMDAQILENSQDIAQKLNASEKGAINGVAELDENGLVPRTQISLSTLREIPFSISVGSWTLSGSLYHADFITAYVTSTSKELVVFDSTIRTSAKYDINVEKKSGAGGMTFTTSVIPTGTLSGTLYVVDSDDGKIPVIIEDTTVAVENGGTGASTASGARQNLGLGLTDDGNGNVTLNI